jgi:SM-20-related protein
MMFDLDKFKATPLEREPFDFVVVPGFLPEEVQSTVAHDFPRIVRPGSFPVGELSYGPSFDLLLGELGGRELEVAMSEKFGLQLAGHPQVVTVRGYCGQQEGRVHTDSRWKIVSVLVYLNNRWEAEGGRLRLLRSDDVHNVAVEVPPEWGTLIAFRRSDRSFHGHLPFEGERRVVQLNWATNQRMIDRELARHRLSAQLKRWLPFTTWRRY